MKVSQKKTRNKFPELGIEKTKMKFNRGRENQESVKKILAREREREHRNDVDDNDDATLRTTSDNTVLT